MSTSHLDILHLSMLPYIMEADISYIYINDTWINIFYNSACVADCFNQVCEIFERFVVVVWFVKKVIYIHGCENVVFNICVCIYVPIFCSYVWWCVKVSFTNTGFNFLFRFPLNALTTQIQNMKSHCFHMLVCVYSLVKNRAIWRNVSRRVNEHSKHAL